MIDSADRLEVVRTVVFYPFGSNLLDGWKFLHVNGGSISDGGRGTRRLRIQGCVRHEDRVKCANTLRMQWMIAVQSVCGLYTVRAGISRSWGTQPK